MTLDELKQHCRIDVDVDDEQLDGLIKFAREWAERYTRRAIIDQVWRLTLARFPLRTVMYDDFGWYHWFARGYIELPRPPFIGLVSFGYIDDSGVSQVMDPSLYGTREEAGVTRIMPAREQVWPMPIDDWNTVSVIYRAGYLALGSPTPSDDTAGVPEAFKQAIKLYAEAHYDRDPVQMPQLIKAAESALTSLRVVTL